MANCGKCSSERAGSDTLSDYDPRQAPRLLRRPTQGQHGGRGCGRGGASPTAPAAVRIQYSPGSLVPRVLCLMVPRPGPERGSEASECRRERGGLCRRVGLSPSYDLGGERLLSGGWKQAYVGEFCSFPSRHPGTHFIWFSPVLPTPALQGRI